MKRIAVSLLLLGTIFLKISSQDDFLIPLLTDNPPVIDGLIDDGCWEQAPTVTGFKTFTPDFGQDMSFPTIVYMLYDAENLYFAFRCYDDDTDKIKVSVNSRDNINADDWVCINLDSFNDQQSLYAFYINANGIQMDSRFSAGIEDPDQDFVWYSAGLIGNEGYTIEVQIPLKSIRFSNREPVEMGVIFERKISREAVQGMYPEMDPAKGFAFLTQMKPMIYQGVKHYKLFELLPAFTYTARNIHDEGLMTKDERNPKVSLTAKYGITSQLVLDGTINPDFSQVEADAGQVDVNLRYNIFYPEKRSFFLEGNDIFNFAATQADEHDPVRTLVHTRSIINPYTGVKLSGKAGERLTLAALYVLDRVGDLNGDGSVESAHFPVLRMKYRIANDGYLGLIYTGREMDTTFNRVMGLDGQIRVSEGSRFEYNALLSSTGREIGSEAQTGYMASAEYSHDSRNINYSLGGKSIGTGFIVDPGYFRRGGINYMKLLVKPKFYPETEFIQRIDVEFFSKQAHDIEYNMWETVDHLASWIYFKGSTYIKVKAAFATEIFLGERFKTGGLYGLLSSQLGKKLSAAVLIRNVGAIRYSDNPYQGYSNMITAMANYKPSEKLHLDLSFTYTDFFITETREKEYDYSIARGKITYQMNKYFFLRGIAEYNSYRNSLLTDFLASFTYIPGTVVYLGYGSLYERIRWESGEYVPDERFIETKRGLFFKCSYLHRF